MTSVITYSKYDPTRLTSLRNEFSRVMNSKFLELIKLIKIAVVDRDVFGLTPRFTSFQMTLPPEGGFAFIRSQQKVEEFIKWLEEQVEKGILTVGEYQQIGQSIEKAWTDMYVLDAYKRGIMRARAEMIAAGMTIPSILESGGIDIVMGLPFHMDRVGVLFSRVYSDLKGITADMDAKISRILAQGMIDGDGPVLLARKIVAVINGDGVDRLGLVDSLGRFIPAQRRAEILARTEMTRAHHLATIQEYRNWGVFGIKVMGEWRTAGDDRVCPQCAELNGEIFTLDEIESMIPAHPMCRCIALPYIEN